jgi:prolyl-tRNA synthetase
MMSDKRALQAGTSHNLGQNFAKAFDVTFQTEDNKLEHVYATSWGVSTRLIGALIMVHGDEKGLRLPPAIAPHQVVVIPIGKSDEDISAIHDYLSSTLTSLNDDGIRVHVDDRLTVSPGFKFNEWEMKGTPVRLEVGARDMEKGSAVVVRRDTGEKSFVERDNLVQEIPKLLDEIQNGLFQQALTFRQENTNTVGNYEEFKELISTEGGFVRCGWDGEPETEAAIREETKASIRLIPFDENPEGMTCIYSGKPAKHEVIFAKAY